MSEFKIHGLSAEGEAYRAALVAIQELHDKGAPVGPRWQCCECFHIWPCATRRLADDALGGGQHE